MKRIAFFVSLVLVFTFAASVASAAYYEAFKHPDVAYADMAYTGIDVDAVDVFCERFLRNPVGLYRALLELYAEVYTQNELAYIAMCQNADDAALSVADAQAEADYACASDAICTALSKALAGPQGNALRSLMPEGEADAFLDYETASDVEINASAEETALIRRYYQLPDDGNFADAAAELYLRLAALRRGAAACEGFDNYPEYAYMVSFAREYLPEDARELQRIVKSGIAPLYVRCVRALDAAPVVWDDGDIPSGAEILDAIGAHIADISPELTEAFDFLRRNQLYCIGSGDKLLDMGYTASLPAYRSGFIFNKASTRYDAFETTVHEFGHFNAIYHDPTALLYQYNNMDVSEVQSQGLELLFLPALQDILAGDDPGGRAIVALSVLSDALGAVVDGCMYDEFEQAVYDDPDMTVSELHALEQRLYAAYGLDGLFNSEPYWVYISHLFEQPCYYISYAASALPALDLWLQSLEDREAAVDAYMRVSAARTDEWFLDVLYDNGLCDITDRRDVARLSQGLGTQIDALIVALPVARSHAGVWIAAAATTAACGAGLFFRLRRRNKKREAA